MNESAIVELVMFKLKAGVDPERFKEAAAQTTLALNRLTGFKHRELLFDDAQEQWVDIVHWSSREAALGALEAFPTMPEARDFEAMIDPTQMTMLHLNQVYATEGIPRY